MSIHRTQFIIVAALSACWAMFADVQTASGHTRIRPKPMTLRKQSQASKFVVVCQVKDLTLVGGHSFHTNLTITKVLKDDPILAGRKELQLPSYLPVKNNNEPSLYIGFGEIEKGEIDLQHGVLATKELAEYFESIVTIDTKDRVKLVRYLVEHWDQKDLNVIQDILLELRELNWTDLQEAAPHIPPEKLRKRLKDDKSFRDARLGASAMLLGFQGNKDDAAVLRSLLNSFITMDSGSDAVGGVLTGFVLLDPTEGWKFLTRITIDKAAPFQRRFAALKTVDCLHGLQPPIVAETQLLEVVGHLLKQKNISHLAIEQLREWKCWKLTDQIFALHQVKEFDSPFLRSSMLRYALVCPDPKAKQYVEQVRKTEPDRVKNMEDYLKDEINQAQKKP